jgi:NhaP-type Na+/H+ or K+/H+ antiporter
MPLFGTLLVTIVVYSLLARRLAPLGISGPLFFMVVGLLAGALGVAPGLLGPLATAQTHDETEHLGLLILEIALALTLFADAANLRPRGMTKMARLPVRLLAIGMPLTIILGTIVALGVMPDLLFWECVILATVLAPTDAALGQAVVSSPAVPKNVRHALNVESGLNDGLSVPVLFLALALAVREAEPVPGSFAWFAFEQIVYGGLIGILIGIAVSTLFPLARRHGWLSKSWEGPAFAAAGIGAWLLADTLGGNGFIAAFVAGLTLHLRRHVSLDDAREFGEDVGALLDMTAFFIFGVLTWDMFGELTWRSWLYAALSLTVIRMVPVALSLLGSGLSATTYAFMGWFGPRGLASIVLGLVVVSEQPELEGLRLVLSTVAAAVFLSIIAHGLTAPALAKAYGRFTSRLPSPAPEIDEGDVQT